MSHTSATLQPVFYSDALSGWFASLSFMPSPHDRLPITLSRYLTSIGPVYICYYIMAVLVVQPGTRLYRLALLPPAAYKAFGAATSWDFTFGDMTNNYMNLGICLSMLALVMRMTEWALQGPPLERIRTDEERKASSVWKDAANLTCNIRGIGWTWSKGWRIPHETRPTHSVTAFLAITAFSFVRDFLVCDTLHYLMQMFGPDTIGSPSGGSIFDYTLPPAQRYLRSSVLTVLCAGMIHFTMEAQYHLATVLAFLFTGFNQDLVDWPPASERPWLSSSLADFWSWRWHQTFRRTFLELGAKPMRSLFGKPAGVFGGFLLSAILHDWSVWGMGHGTDFSRFGGFFLLNALGIVLERIWKSGMGRKVHGPMGWAWTMVWLVGTGNIIVDAFLTRGLAGCATLPMHMRPGKMLVDHIVQKM